jgi:hypothetical protein
MKEGDILMMNIDTESQVEALDYYTYNRLTTLLNEMSNSVFFSMHLDVYQQVSDHIIIPCNIVIRQIHDQTRNGFH